jgi:hypothetical protein
MNLYSSFCVNRFAARIQSKKNGATCWPEFRGFCLNLNCRRFLQADGGIFCANYFARRGAFAPCLSSWCGPCYRSLEIRRFPIRQKVDDDGGIIEDDNNDIRFKCARAGDHLMMNPLPTIQFLFPVLLLPIHPPTTVNQSLALFLVLPVSTR